MRWSSAPFARRAAWPSICVTALAAAARSASSWLPGAWRSWPSAPARSRARSVSAWPARRSPTGWSPSSTPTPGRSGKGKLRAPTEFGFVVQLAELCENTRRGARGLIVPAASQIGSPNEPDLLPATAAELDRLNLRPRELALDGGFFPIGVAEDLPDPQRVFIAGRQSAGSRRTNRRLARFRVGIEGRISHLKRRYGLRRSRLKGHHGARTWTAWAILAYNLDTLAIRAA